MKVQAEVWRTTHYRSLNQPETSSLMALSKSWKKSDGGLLASIAWGILCSFGVHVSLLEMLVGNYQVLQELAQDLECDSTRSQEPAAGN
jgi:hypothetical protein